VVSQRRSQEQVLGSYVEEQQHGRIPLEREARELPQAVDGRDSGPRPRSAHPRAGAV